MLPFILIVLAFVARFFPHVPNFTPMLAIALFSGAYLPRKYAMWLPLVLMIATDIIVGFHMTIPFTWGSILLITWFGTVLKQNKNSANMLGASLASAIFFFIVTNCGSWLIYYPKTMSGFTTCFTLAIPFFRATLLSTVAYTVVLIVGHAVIARGVKDTQLAAVLLPSK